jgi:hypothetical protein
LTNRASSSVRFSNVCSTPRRDEHERTRPADDLLAVRGEDELAFEHVERVVLARVDMGWRPVPSRLDRDDREVEARRVGGSREELDVPDPVPLAGMHDHDPISAHRSSRSLD